MAGFGRDLRGEVVGRNARIDVFDIPGLPVIDVIEAVLAGVRDRLLPALVNEDELADGTVPVIRIVGYFLEVPIQLARVDIQRHHGGDVEIQPWAGSRGHPVFRAPVVQGVRVAGAPEDLLVFGIVLAGLPSAAATVFPGIAAPGFVGRRIVVRTGDGPERPLGRAGFAIEPENAAPNRPFARLLTDHDGAIRIRASAGESDGILDGVNEG